MDRSLEEIASCRHPFIVRAPGMCHTVCCVSRASGQEALMDLRLSYTESEDTFPLPAGIREQYGPFGFPETGGLPRPYISSNLVMGLDGRTSFRELKVHSGGREHSRRKTDLWLVGFLRAPHDVVL